MKNIRVFLSENFQVLEVKFSIYLNRRVSVMLLFISVRLNSFMIYMVNSGVLSYTKLDWKGVK